MALRTSLMPKSYLLEAVAVPRLICMLLPPPDPIPVTSLYLLLLGVNNFSKQIRSERLCLILCSAPRLKFFRIWPLKFQLSISAICLSGLGCDMVVLHSRGSQSIGPSAITNSFNNKSEGTQDFSNATIKIERCSCASTSRVRVIASSFNNKGNGIQNFSNATIIIMANCCGSLGLHGSRSIESSVLNSFNNEGNGLQDFSNSTVIVGSCSCTSTCVELKTHQTGLIKQKLDRGMFNL
ncbi:hypothetical protein VNO80_16485 [Phaseolus coccineus]|uniref:Uncharacterized protein n=1 Tax=Phaseolus coccineus TaxID=3886 RepID=A0AAN9MS69_PHACN